MKKLSPSESSLRKKNTAETASITQVSRASSFFGNSCSKLTGYLNLRTKPKKHPELDIDGSRTRVTCLSSTKSPKYRPEYDRQKFAKRDPCSKVRNGRNDTNASNIGYHESAASTVSCKNSRPKSLSKVKLEANKVCR